MREACQTVSRSVENVQNMGIKNRAADCPSDPNGGKGAYAAGEASAAALGRAQADKKLGD